MLVHRLRRWPKMKTELGGRVVFVGIGAVAFPAYRFSVITKERGHKPSLWDKVASESADVSSVLLQSSDSTSSLLRPHSHNHQDIVLTL